MSCSQSRAAENDGKVFSSAESDKRSHYSNMAAERKATVVPFVVTIPGKINEAGLKLVKELQEFGQRQQYPRWINSSACWGVKRELSVSLQRSATELIDDWKRRNRSDLGM